MSGIFHLFHYNIRFFFEMASFAHGMFDVAVFVGISRKEMPLLYPGHERIHCLVPSKGSMF